jgi:hypothetical protein
MGDEQMRMEGTGYEQPRIIDNARQGSGSYGSRTAAWAGRNPCVQTMCCLGGLTVASLATIAAVKLFAYAAILAVGAHVAAIIGKWSAVAFFAGKTVIIGAAALGASYLVVKGLGFSCLSCSRCCC